MKTYRDKTGREIKVGDVLIYDEGEGFGRSIDEVVDHDGELAAVIRVGLPEWTVIKDQEPILLRYFKVFPEHNENVTIDAKVSDVTPAEAFTAEHAASVFGASGY